MRTEFTLAQLADPDTAASEKILRACVHCGFCTATCPTYVLLGDELDSPRGRIYLIKNMLEGSVPVGRALHAPRRSRPAPYRGALPPPLGRAVAAVFARPGVDAAPADARGIARGPPRETVCGLAAEAAAAARRFGAKHATGALAGRSAADLPRPRRAAHSGRAVAGLCAAGADAGDQRGDDPLADPAWRGSRCRAGERLLRSPHPPSGR